MKRDKLRFSRRALLRTLGISAATAPFVPLLNASGDEPTVPRRLLLIYTPHGTVWEGWRPSAHGSIFSFGPILAPLERHRDKLLILEGMRVIADTSVGAPHTKGPPLLWTASPLIEDTTFSRDDGMGVYYFGWNSGPSFDQVVADAVGMATPYRSIELGVRPGAHFPGHRMIYRGAEAPLAPEADPHAALGRLFGGGTEIDRLRAERRSVIDSVRAELDLVRPAIGRDDRPKIDSHLEAIREIERALTAPTGCEAPMIGDRVDPLANDNMPLVLDAQMQLLARIFACDLTRVASLQISVGENDGTVYNWLGVSREVHHLITHENNASALAELSTIYTWYADRVARLLDLLDAVPEGDGTVLDHTLVVWGSEIGRGWDHNFDEVPFVLAGGGAHGLRTGRALGYDGQPHNRLLVSLCQAMGLEEMESFGTTDPGTGPLPDLV